MTRRKIIVGNWKMNTHLDSALELVSSIVQLAKTEKIMPMVICPPFPYLFAVAQRLIEKKSDIGLGAQNLAVVKDQGAYTGEVSGSMLSDIGCQYVIIGHSERRTIYGENDKTIADKFKIAKICQLVPILCLGETLAERETQATEEVIKKQIDVVIAENGVDSFKNVVIAYEPVWAIGTGLSATPEQAQQIHGFIRGYLSGLIGDSSVKISILYGGSLNPKNAQDLLSQQDIDGGLIGGASLVAKDFIQIAKIGFSVNLT